jgi:hypothetical protein
MIDLEVDILRWAARTSDLSERAIDRLCIVHGLSVTTKTTLSKHPGSVHWHLKRGRERGTLEVTLWPSAKRLWFSMQDGRKGEWVMETAGLLKQQLERTLNRR